MALRNRTSRICPFSRPPVRKPRSSAAACRAAVLAGVTGLLFAGTAALAQTPVSIPPSVFPAPAAPAQPAPSAPAQLTVAPPVAAVPPEVKAASAILVDVNTGTILWEKNARVRRPIASTTKIMTATLLIESGRLDDTVSFSENARYTPYANLNAKPGEQFKMQELLYAILMRSSNDGCVAAAEHLAGSAGRFAQWMNDKARTLGATDTHFVTVNGLYDPQHYSSARDLSIFARNAMQFPLFNQIVGTQEHQLQRSINWKDTLLRNHNKFLSRYEGADGVKTGYVRQSGKCLVASATRPEGNSPWRLLTVVLNSPDIYGDSARLMDWGRKYYAPVVVTRRGETLGTAQVRGGMRPNVTLAAKEDLVVILPRQMGKNIEREIHTPESLPAPVAQGQAAGTVTAVVDGIPQCHAEIVADAPVAPQVWTAGIVSPWTGGWMMALAVFLFGPRYARAFAKSARRRRRRLAARCGEPDRQWEGHR